MATLIYNVFFILFFVLSFLRSCLNNCICISLRTFLVEILFYSIRPNLLAAQLNVIIEMVLNSLPASPFYADLRISLTSSSKLLHAFLSYVNGHLMRVRIALLGVAVTGA